MYLVNINKMKVRKRLVSRGRRYRKKRFQALAVKALSAVAVAVAVAAWIIGIFVFMTKPAGTTLSTSTLPISPSSLNDVNYGSQLLSSGSLNDAKYESPLLIFTFKRPEYLEKTLQNVLSTIPQPCGFGCPVVVSEDGRHEEIKDVVLLFKNKFEEKDIPLIHIRHERSVRSTANAYKALAKHYGWALSQVFDGIFKSSFIQRVVILEEDIKVAPDFFSYMEATSSLLDHDPTLYAVSAFNDNGYFPNGDPKRVLRSDFFPGLGWMINRNLWKSELESKWPRGWWDDWLREPAQRKDRQVLRPEVSRTHHFGSKGGASKNAFGRRLERNKLNEKVIQWDMEDLSYLESSLYENQYTKQVMSSKLVHSINEVKEAKHARSGSNVRLEYKDFSHFSELAAHLKIMKDEKAMVPRTAYRGIVEVRLGSTLLFLTPKGGFQGYKSKATEERHSI